MLAATVHSADRADTATLVETVLHAPRNLVRAGSDQEVVEVAADTGCHKAETLAECEGLGLRSSIPEPQRPAYRWADKPAAHRRATLGNRRRGRGGRSKRLQKTRSEYVERSFAHGCETGGGRSFHPTGD